MVTETQEEEAPDEPAIASPPEMGEEAINPPRKLLGRAIDEPFILAAQPQRQGTIDQPDPTLAIPKATEQMSGTPTPARKAPLRKPFLSPNNEASAPAPPPALCHKP